MKSNLIIGLLGIIVLLNSCGERPLSATSLSPNGFAEKIEEFPAAPIIDVRTPEEYAQGHLINARNINWKGNDFEKQISTLDKTKPVFIYCLKGGRSEEAATHMRSQGFKEVYELNGGFKKWHATNLPEAKGD